MKPQVQPPVWLPVPRGQGLRFYQVTFPALGTQLDVFSGAFEDPLSWRFVYRPVDNRSLAKGHEGNRYEPALHSIVEEAVIADSVKRRRKDVIHESPEELVGFESLFFAFTVILPVCVGNSDRRLIDVEDAGVTDGDAMGIA